MSIVLTSKRGVRVNIMPHATGSRVVIRGIAGKVYDQQFAHRNKGAIMSTVARLGW